MSACTELFPQASSISRRAIEDLTTEQLIRALSAAECGSASPTIDPTRFAAELESFDFSGAQPLELVAAWVIEAMSRGAVQMTHPRCLGLFNPAPTIAAETADRIAAAFNPQLAVWSHAPVASAIERHVIAAMAQKIGFDASCAGHFTSGGAEANLTAMLCALSGANAQHAQDGVSAFGGAQPVLYASRESHLAWLKIACITGIGRSGVTLVRTDGQGRMDVAELRRAIAEDRSAGRTPAMIAATAGTTNAGMIDPLVACAEIAGENQMWLHVDAAWGGAMLASDELRSHLEGIELACSVTIDAHKWFAATMGTGMFFTRCPDLLSRVFSVTAGYMPSDDAQRDAYLSSVLWSRRFVGLRLFMGLATVGWAGYAQHIERSVRLAERLGQRLTHDGWSVVNASPMGVLCLRPPSGSPTPPELVRRIVQDGVAWVSAAQFEGEELVRACVTNGRTTESDIDTVARALHQASASVS